MEDFMRKIQVKIEPEPLKSILYRWLKKNHNIEKEWQKYQIFGRWNQIIDDRIRKHTKPFQFNSQILTILVDSAPYHFELNNFRRKNLLQKLQQINLEIPIRDICFICKRLSK